MFCWLVGVVQVVKMLVQVVLQVLCSTTVDTNSLLELHTHL